MEPVAGTLPGPSGLSEPLAIGTVTPWGSIQAVGMTLGERYYWMVKGKDVAMIPASTVEQMYDAAQAAPEPKAKGSTPMSSHQIQAMAKLIDDIDELADALPCESESHYRCQILLLIDVYRNQFQVRKGSPPLPPQQTSNPGVTPE